MNDFSSSLEPYLAAWRADSRQGARPHSRERAREAMLAAAASPAPAYRRVAAVLSAQSTFRLRSRFPQRAGALAAVTATVVTAFLGWNAPAGSSLYGVRAARQSVQLVVPGANLAALHLEFAAQSLADARNGISPAASLADARSELDAARSELPADHTAPLWAQWSGDEAVLANEEAALGDGQGPTNRVLPPPAGPRETPSEGRNEPRTSTEAGRSTSPRTESPETMPSATDGGSNTPPASSASPNGG
jgi:hypothetical protein